MFAAAATLLPGTQPILFASAFLSSLAAAAMMLRR
jgi:hypothetical protein